MKMTVTIRIPCEFTPKGNWVVATCPALDVVTQGRDETQAEKNLLEALEVFLSSCIERGVLEQVMADCGFSISPPKRIIEKAIKDAQRHVEVSVPLFSNSNNCGSPCHV